MATKFDIGRCCGCRSCSCCPTSPTQWSISFSSGWGVGSASACVAFPGPGASLCSQIGVLGTFASPIVSLFPGILDAGSWPDAQVQGAETYIIPANRKCLSSPVLRTYNLFDCYLKMRVALYQAPSEGCRLVVGFELGPNGFNYMLYRSAEIADCCTPLTLSYYSAGFTGPCSLKPATITATPTCA